jgi:hypothetical protein
VKTIEPGRSRTRKTRQPGDVGPSTPPEVRDDRQGRVRLERGNERGRQDGSSINWTS